MGSGWGGSSPLARGLPGELPELLRLGRIIPARAGFTRGRSASSPAARDHPRSRGVYAEPSQDMRNRVGSSPLARGLLEAEDLGGAIKRIIPARAGFTAADRRPPSCFRDHPRSRGVYPWIRQTGLSAPGSSPLARGLHLPPEDRHIRRGIIPARAGFTPSGAPCPIPLADHPRSRGVYPQGSSSVPLPPGSSPLARGLRPGRPGREVLGRIIPARAGFTSGTDRRDRREGDHPRSRGVYFGASGVPYCDMGSSPLARGLHNAFSIFYFDTRIIPARAGFTKVTRSPGRMLQDHPRSRGVYNVTAFPIWLDTGSSPLARGLLV